MKKKIKFNYRLEKGMSPAFSLVSRGKKKEFTITFFHRSVYNEKDCIHFRVRTPKKNEPWFDITLANYQLNFGWL